MSDPMDDVFSLRRHPVSSKPPAEEKAKPADKVFPGSRPLRDIEVAQRRDNEPVDPEWDTSPVHKMLGGQLTEFFLIGHLAAALGRTAVTIRSWEQKGWLPLSQYRTPAPLSQTIPDKNAMGRRLYTRGQVEVTIAAAAKHGVMKNNARNADWKGFTRAVLTGWKTLS